MTSRSTVSGLCAWLLVQACAPAGPPADTSRRQTLVIGVAADVGTLNPLAAGANQDVIQPMTLPTVESGFDCGPTGAPGYARAWSWNESGTVLTMELREDLSWEDGVPVTVDDLVFTFDVLADPQVASPWMSLVEHLAPDGRPRVLDATHVAWEFTHPYDRATQLAHVGEVSLLPKHRLGGVDRAALLGDAHGSTYLSYGPFRVAEWRKGESLALEPNPTYRGPHPAKLRRVVWRVIPDYSTRVAALESGELDLVDGVRLEDAERLRTSRPELRWERRTGRAVDYVTWNLSHPLLRDRDVRRALAMATDVPGLIARLHTGASGEVVAQRSVGTLSPALCAAYADHIAPIAFDVDGAKALLAGAGFADADGDGVVERGAERLVLELLVNSDNVRMNEVALVLQQAWKAVGAAVEIQRAPKAALYERLMKRDYTAAIGAWNAALFVDPSSQWECDTPARPRPFNFPGYCEPAVDALISRGMSLTDPAQAAPVWKELQARIYEDQPYLFLYWMDELVAVDPRFANTSIDVLSPVGRLYAWTVDPVAAAEPSPGRRPGE
jgi:peptide/nickel transport system substrate-binding protein